MAESHSADTEHSSLRDILCAGGSADQTSSVSAHTHAHVCTRSPRAAVLLPDLGSGVVEFVEVGD